MFGLPSFTTLTGGVYESTNDYTRDGLWISINGQTPAEGFHVRTYDKIRIQETKSLASLSI